MSYPIITRSTTDSFNTLRVDTGVIALVLMPQLGGKISSLRDLRSGREWLWRHPRLPYERVPYYHSYVERADTGGWDECFPTVAPCAYPLSPWQGVAVPDHGELWSQAVDLEIAERTDQIVLHTRWEGVALPYVFERVITLAARSSRIHVAYSVTNMASSPMVWIWCAHPLLAIEPGMQLVFPATARFHRWTTIPPDLLDRTHDLRYPLTLHTGTRALDLATLPDASAAAALKLWSDPLDEGWAKLRAVNGEFAMRWDVAHLPQVACWLNLGGGAAGGGTPLYNLGLEPCIGAQDSLVEAVTLYDRYATLPPHGSYSWWLEIELSA